MQEKYIPHGNTDGHPIAIQQLAEGGITDFCVQVCGGGECGNGTLCMLGIDPDTHMPPALSAAETVPCVICKWPEATHEVPFCEECIKYVTRVAP